MIHLSTSLSYYKREDVQKAIVEHGRDKEVAARFNEQFGKRPDSLSYPNEVLELAKKGATSFHCSEELWTNPLLLKPQMARAELDKLRRGWDLILDVDTDVIDKETGFEYSKIAADLIIKQLKLHGVRSVTAKFSGNKGFHIAVPYEAFPKTFKGVECHLLFPEVAKKVASYLKEQIQKDLGRSILLLEKGDYNAIEKKTGKKKHEFVYMKTVKGGFESESLPEFNAEPFLVIDTILISARHMYRMPYSLHEKSGLASIPVNIDKVLEFNRESATPEKVKVGENLFMNRQNSISGETLRLFTEADDYGRSQTVKATEREKSANVEYEEVEGKIPSEFFPPCIKKMLEGVVDGRKRAMFVLANFLGSCNYGNDEIEAIIKEWNQKNREPLPPLTLATQLSYQKQRKEKILPPNCNNASYYKELGIECTPECGKCKNPVAEAKYIFRRAMKLAGKTAAKTLKNV